MPHDESRRTTEDVMGVYGFRLVWSVTDYTADVVAYEIVARSETEDGPALFRIKDWSDSMDTTQDVAGAEPYLIGYVRWDGCSRIDIEEDHFCGASDFRRHCDLMRHIYERAFILMGREPDEPWETRHVA